jgi:hypothetical protein
MKKMLLSLLLLGGVVNAMEMDDEAASMLVALSTGSRLKLDVVEPMAVMQPVFENPYLNQEAKYFAFNVAKSQPVEVSLKPATSIKPIDVTNDDIDSVCTSDSSKKRTIAQKDVKNKKKQKIDPEKEAIGEVVRNVSGKFECPYCEYFSNNRGTTNKHVERKHKNVDKFGCASCPSKFPTKAELRDHTNRKHVKDDSKMFHCSQCNYSNACWAAFSTHCFGLHGITVVRSKQLTQPNT